MQLFKHKRAKKINGKTLKSKWFIAYALEACRKAMAGFQMLRRLIGWIVFEVQYLSFIYIFIINAIILPTNDEIFMNSCKLIFVNVK